MATGCTAPAYDIEKRGTKLEGSRGKCGKRKAAHHSSSRFLMHQNHAELIHTAPELFSKEMTGGGGRKGRCKGRHMINYF